MKSYGKSIIDLEFFQEKQRFFANTLIFSLLFAPPPCGHFGFCKVDIIFYKKILKNFVDLKKSSTFAAFLYRPEYAFG